MKTITIITENGDEIMVKNVKEIIENEDKGKRDFEFKEGKGFTIDGGCKVFEDFQIPIRNFKERKEIGNMFYTEEEAEKAAKEVELYFRLRRFAEIVNEGWKPDWNNEKERKYCCFFFNQEPKEWVVNFVAVWKCINTIYFKTEDLAQRAINEVIIPFENGKL